MSTSIKLQIKSWLGKVLFEYEKENNTIKATLEQAVLTDADLRGARLTDAVLTDAVLTDADLRDADLRGAVLRGAVLTGARLTDAVLTDAVLTDADLRDADLRGAVLRGAVLTGAVLTGADLTDAVLTDADLTDADLRDADLRGAVLRGAVLRDIKADFFEILIHSIPEVDGLKKALKEGKVNGSTYTGDCCCLVGTIANTRGCKYTGLIDIKPDGTRPAERFFAGIQKGDTPENSQIAKIVLEWIDEFQHYVTP